MISDELEWNGNTISTDKFTYDYKRVEKWDRQLTCLLSPHYTIYILISKNLEYLMVHGGVVITVAAEVAINHLTPLLSLP